MMTTRIKIATPRIVYPIENVKKNFTSESYYNGAKSILNKVNEHLGLPLNIVNKRLLEDRYDEILKFILDHYVINSHKDLTSKMATLAACLKFGGHEMTKFDRMRKTLLLLPIEVKEVVKDVPNWQDVLPILDKIISEHRMLSARALACCYKHGYVLRIGEIFATTTDLSKSDEYNFLDVQKKIWKIKGELTKNRLERSFHVSQEFLDELVPFVSKHGFLLYRRCGLPYAPVCQNLRVLELSEWLPSVHILRNSFETWNKSRQDLSQQQKDLNTLSLGHTIQTAEAYYIKNETTSLTNELLL